VAYQIKVSDNNQMIFLRLSGEVTMNDIYYYNQALVTAICANPDEMTHLLIDASDLTSFPGNLQAVRRLMTYLNEPTLGYVVDWGNRNTNFYFIHSVLLQMASLSHASCTTEREAMQRIDLTLCKKAKRSTMTMTWLPVL
jgi:hypothetical protein